jgi:heme-degrading monooxygenase HmoA
MHAVVNQLHFNKPVDEFRASLTDELLPLITSLPGFIDFYFVKVRDDQAIAIIFWQDAASAEQGANTIGPTWFAEKIAPFLASDQQRSTGEVIVSSRY